MIYGGDVYVYNLKVSLANKEIKYLSKSAALREHLTINKMLTSSKSESMEKNDTNIENVPNQTNENKVKILSQTLLQAANLTSRKEFLNRVLQNSASKIKILNQARKENDIKNQEHKTILSNKNKPGKTANDLHLQKQENPNLSKVNTSDDAISSFAKNNKFNPLSLSSDSNSGQTQFIEGIQKVKENKSDSEEGSSAEDNTNKDKSTERKMEVLSDSSSSAEFEKQIRKTQISKLDISESISTPDTHTVDSKSNKQENNTKMTQKKLEFLSESSDAEHKKEDIGNTKKKFTKQNKLQKSNQKRVKSESSSGESKDETDKAVKKKNCDKKKDMIRNTKHLSSTSSDSENNNKLSSLKERPVLSSKDAKTIHKSDSSNSDTPTHIIKDNTKGKSSNKSSIKGSPKSKLKPESSNSDSDDNSSKDNKKIMTSNSKQHKNTLKKSEVSSMDSESDSSSSERSTHKSDSTSSDSETDISKGDRKKRTSSDSRSKLTNASNTEGKSKLKHHRSDSSSSNSTDDFTKGKERTSETNNTLKKSKLSRQDSSDHKSDSSGSDSKTDSSEHDKKRISNKAEKKYTSERNIKEKSKSKHSNSDSSSSDSEDDFTESKERKTSENKNTLKKSKLSRQDSSSHKSDSSSSDSETDSSEHDKKRISNKTDKKYKSKHRKSDASSSDSEDDSTKGNKKMKISGGKEDKTKGKKYISKSKISDTDTDSSTSNASTSSIKNKSSRKRKLSEIKSSDGESEELLNKKQKRSADFKKPESESAKLLQSFAESNEYSKVLPKRGNLVDMLDKNEEVYLVQMPKCIDPRSLADKNLSFDRPTKLKLESESYIWDVNHEYKHDACIVDFNNLLKIRLDGVITLQQHFNSRNKSVEVEPTHDIEDVPNNLKVRHPLFGTDYQEKIQLDADILAKLDEISTTINKKHKKKSKKKHKKEIENEQPESLDIFKLLNERENQKKEDNYESKAGAVKKHKKHKVKRESKTHEAEHEIQSIISEMFPEVQKTKKKENSSETSINYDCAKSKDKRKDKSNLADTNKSDETALSIPSIDYKGIRRKSKDNRHSSDPIQEEDLSESHSEKHKKKKKRRSSINLNDSVVSASVVDDSSMQMENKRQEKDYSFGSSAPIQEDPQEGLSESHSEKYKKKKKRKSSISLNDNVASASVVDDSIMQMENKRQDKDNSFDSFAPIQKDPQEGLSESHSGRHKKKKKRKSSISLNDNVASASVVDDSIMQIENKRRDKDYSFDSLAPIQKDLQEGLPENHSEKHKKKKKRKSSISLGDSVVSASVVDDSIMQMENKRQDKDYSFDSSAPIQKDLQEGLPENHSEKHKKKKKRKSSISLGDSVVSASVLDDSIMQMENKTQDKDYSASNLSEVGNKKHKKKKKEKRNTNEIVNSTMSTSTVSNIFQLDESCIPKVKKKKHGKHRNSIDHFVDDLVKSITSSDDTLNIDKKKRKRSNSERT